MSTNLEPRKSNSTSIWKIVLIVIAVLIALSIIGPLLKAAFWVVLIGLAIVGAGALFFGGKKS
ncbi:hypothetical protein [Gordonia neofelifaecis]|uniref:hypothetical protein n=1 Tax=Gordonia neofelifaecis TaxID=945692 RepID=UPI0003004CBF|nr:hypothetical protein [Gordonia neofelifaecis]